MHFFVCLNVYADDSVNKVHIKPIKINETYSHKISKYW